MKKHQTIKKYPPPSHSKKNQKMKKFKKKKKSKKNKHLNPEPSGVLLVDLYSSVITTSNTAHEKHK